MNIRSKDRWVELGVGLAAGTAGALGLWAVGLSELAWLPYALVAVEGTRRRTIGLRRGARR